MTMKPSLWPDERFTAIVPIIKVSLDGVPSLIGTGFFITERGHLITAKHVIDDNIDDKHNDIGGIGAILFDQSNFGEYLPLLQTDRHPNSDIAVSSTRPRYSKDGARIKTPILKMSADAPQKNATIHSRFFCHPDFDTSIKDLDLPPGELVVGTFNLTHSFEPRTPGMSETSAGFLESKFGYQTRVGRLQEHYRPMRDKIVLPFPVFESNLAIPPSGSGGPVFDDAGFVVGINTTGFSGTDIAYHTYIESVLVLGISVLVPLGLLAETGELEMKGLSAAEKTWNRR